MTKNEHKHLISCLVEDQPGALFRISGMFCSRGYNIDSLAVGGTQVPGLSRLSLVCRGDDHRVDQIVHQLNKLAEIVSVSDLSWDDRVESELMLIKVTGDKKKLSEISRTFHARAKDNGDQGFIIEASGDAEEIDDLIKSLAPFGIQEVSRSGTIVLQRGNAVLDASLKEAWKKALASGRHRPGGKPMSGADMIVRLLREEGVDVLFGYSGASVLPLLDSLFQHNCHR